MLATGTCTHLKMRKLHTKVAIFPPFQSTILQTFFGLTKFFY